MSEKSAELKWVVLYRRGLDAYRRGDAAGALVLLERALAVIRLCSPQAASNEARLRCDLGGVLGAMGRHDDAAKQLREAVRLRPDYADAWRNLGVALEKLGRFEEAVDAYRRAVELRPGDARAAAFMGNALLAMGREEEAQGCYERAVALDPKLAEVRAGSTSSSQASLGMLRHKGGRFMGAIGPLSSAVRQRPDDEGSWRKLLDSYVQIGDVEGFLNACRERLKACPSDHHTRSAMLYAMHYSEAYGPAELHAAHVEWASVLGVERGEAASGGRWQPPNGGRRLRIGYVSPDFRSHTVTRFISPAIQYHDRERFEVICYSNSSREDETTARLKQWATGWRDISPLDDLQACRLIREDRIDILIDLRGHGSGNRLKLFALKPAPIQATMVGYFDTTGLPQMDYRITDEWQDPQGVSEQYHTESLARLPGSCWCYDPYGEWPEISEPPAMRAGHVTFGCLNKIMKVSRRCAELWAQVLHQVPNSRLALVAPNADCARFTQDRLRCYGFPVERLDIWPKTAGRTEYLERFNRIDISLDPLPFNGITTTCESLWMGVPVVSLSGGTSVSRAGRSILHAAGMGEWAVPIPEGYVKGAMSLARDLDSLRRHRRELRERLRCSPLLDGRGFARRLEAAFAQVSGAPPPSSVPRPHND